VMILIVSMCVVFALNAALKYVIQGCLVEVSSAYYVEDENAD